MPRGGSQALELTYPLRTVARLTGLSPEVLRAWERRYRVVTPARTPGGTRRYSAADLERLRLLKAAVDAGHRIGDVARLDVAELSRRSTRVPLSRDRPTTQSPRVSVRPSGRWQSQALVQPVLSATCHS